MKRIFVTIIVLFGVLSLSGCASMFFPSAGKGSGSNSEAAGIDPVTQAAIDQSNAQSFQSAIDAANSNAAAAAGQ